MASAKPTAVGKFLDARKCGMSRVRTSLSTILEIVFRLEMGRYYIKMGDSRRPTPSHRLNAYCTVIVRVSYGYGYTRGSGRVWIEIFGAGRVRVRVASSATSTGRVAEMVDPHTPKVKAGMVRVWVKGKTV